MDYALHYQRLVGRAKDRVLSGYVERHHVVPKCLGGSDDKDNIVELTASEHYVAHQLLVKMHPNHVGLLWALSSMTYATKVMVRSNKRYAWLRSRFAEAMRSRFKGKPLTNEHKAKLSEAHKGKNTGLRSDETRKRISEALRGKKKSTEHVLAMAAAKTGKKRGPMSEQTKQRIREGNLASLSVRDFSYMQDPTYRASQAAKMREVWALRKLSK